MNVAGPTNLSLRGGSCSGNGQPGQPRRLQGHGVGRPRGLCALLLGRLRRRRRRHRPARPDEDLHRSPTTISRPRSPSSRTSSTTTAALRRRLRFTMTIDGVTAQGGNSFPGAAAPVSPRRSRPSALQRHRELRCRLHADERIGRLLRHDRARSAQDLHDHERRPGGDADRRQAGRQRQRRHRRRSDLDDDGRRPAPTRRLPGAEPSGSSGASFDRAPTTVSESGPAVTPPSLGLHRPTLRR